MTSDAAPLTRASSIASRPDEIGRSSGSSPRARLPARPFLQSVTVSWLNKVLDQGRTAPLTEETLPDLPNDENQAASARALDGFWDQCQTYWINKEASQSNGSSRVPSLARAGLRYFRAYYAVGFVLNFVTVALAILQPLMIPQILALLVPGSSNHAVIVHNLYALAAIIFGMQILSAFSTYMYQSLNISLGVKTNAILVSAIYEKSLRISSKVQKQFTAGKMNTLIGADVAAVSAAPVFLINLCALITQLVIAIALLFYYLRVAAVPAIVLYAVLIMFEIRFMPRIAGNIRIYSRAMDARSKTLREFLMQIKFIKIRAIESLWRTKIQKHRHDQVMSNHRIMRVFASIYTSASIRQYMIPTISILVYAAFNDLEVSTVFTSLALLDAVSQPSGVMNATIGQLLKVPVSYNRITEFLLAEESNAAEATVRKVTDESSGGDAIRLAGACFTWENDAKAPPAAKPSGPAAPAAAATVTPTSSPFTLQNLNLCVPMGALCAVVGPNGSGKSSLISALAGGMRKTTGDATVYGSLSYCPQEPWIMSGSVKDNILFGDPSVEPRLPLAIEASCLEHDLELMTHGLETLIGEKGVNLSGGQRSRVALARAVARDDDVVLLDDPTAALDAHVGKKVFDQTVSRILRHKTVIMATHQLHLLPRTDVVVVMDGGRILEVGTFEHLMQKKDGRLSDMMKSYVYDEHDRHASPPIDDEVTLKAVKTFETQRAVAEDRRSGAFTWATVHSYFRSGGAAFLPGFLFLTTLLIACTSFTKIYLALWMEDKFHLETSVSVKIYAGLGAINTILIFSVCLFVIYCGMKACIKIHDLAMEGLQNAPLNFFDDQPAGRILNRMTIDVRELDGNLPLNIYITTREFSYFAAAVVVVCYSAPYILALFAVIVLVSGYFYRLFRPSFREMKRLVSLLLSPVLVHTSETMHGVASIKAYGAQDHFISALHAKVDRSNSASLHFQSSKVWLGLRLDLMTSLITTVLVLLGAANVVDGVAVGLGLTGAISLGSWFNSVLVAYTSTEAMFNGIERLNHYAEKVPREPDRIVKGDPVIGTWPDRGVVQVKDLVLRYPSRPDVNVIDRVSFTTSPGEKVAILGRSGSGKSSLVSSLFRVLEASDGSITVDGRDISTLGIETLRRGILCVPQEPTVVTATLRDNVDLLGSHTDDQVWRALSVVGMDRLASDHASKLDRPMTEGGSDLSQGHRALVALSRAALEAGEDDDGRGVRLVVLDEATAALDSEGQRRMDDMLFGTDAPLKKATVLAVMHSLVSVGRYDRVMVFEDGRLVEVGRPKELLDVEDGRFKGMVEATGPANAKAISEMARDTDVHRV